MECKILQSTPPPTPHPHPPIHIPKGLKQGAGRLVHVTPVQGFAASKSDARGQVYTQDRLSKYKTAGCLQ